MHLFNYQPPFIYLLTFYFATFIYALPFPRNETYPVLSSGLDCPSPYQNITNFGECIYAAEVLNFPDYSQDRQVQDPGYGPHGCLWEKGKYTPVGSFNWVIFNPSPSSQPANFWGRQIICQALYATASEEGTCPEGFFAITDRSTCSAAGAYLEITDNNVEDTSLTDGPCRPQGCYYTSGHHSDNTKLYFNGHRLRDDDDDSCDSDDLGDSDDGHHVYNMICRKKWAVRLFAVNINDATSIQYVTDSSDSRVLLEAGTSFKTLDFLDPGESFTVSYHRLGQPQECFFRHLDAETGNLLESDTITEQIPTGIPSVVTINLYCVTSSPTMMPTTVPSVNPTMFPSLNPTFHPTQQPSASPRMMPTIAPSVNPTMFPSLNPTFHPTQQPSTDPTIQPTLSPSQEPSAGQTTQPTISPTMRPTTPTMDPTTYPTTQPSYAPSLNPTFSPTVTPSTSPSPAPSATPCDERSQENCTPDNGPYCYFDRSNDTCVEIPACPSTGPISCESYCGVEVDVCGVAPLTDGSFCSCELCADVTSCVGTRTAVLRFDGEFDDVFPLETREERKALFLSECRGVLAPVNCTSVWAGSIYLTIEGQKDLVDQAEDEINANGLTLSSFGTFQIFASPRNNPTHHEDDEKFGTIWIVLIIVLLCLCILVGCFLNHRRKTYHNYKGGATPRPDPNAVLEMDGKKVDYEDVYV